MATANRPAADAFLDHFGLLPRRPDLALLHQLGHAFSRLPYENLTKLIAKHARHGADRRRQPAEVVADHVSLGTGGTCFSLTALFSAVLERLGYQSHPVLCDMRHGRDLHCALVVGLESGRYLLDPAYLLDAPLPLDLTSAAGPARLEPAGDGTADLHSYGTWRYRLKLAPVPWERLVEVWDASFEWTMMNGVHVCRATAGGYSYVHGHRLRLRTADAKRTLNIRGHEPAELAGRFGIAPAVASEAYRLVAAARRPR